MYAEKHYAVWDNKTDEFICMGSTEQCAAVLGRSRGSFHSCVSRCRSGKNNRWTIIEIDGETGEFIENESD